jgi:hypothetical protein
MQYVKLKKQVCPYNEPLILDIYNCLPVILKDCLNPIAIKPVRDFEDNCSAMNLTNLLMWWKSQDQ